MCTFSDSVNNYGDYEIYDYSVLPGKKECANYNSPGTWTLVSSIPGPRADFSATPTSGPAPLAVQFTDASQNQVTSWSWSFGDGIGFSTSQNPSYTYTKPGTYNVSLAVAGPDGQDTKTSPAYITVTAPPPAPIANFTATPLSGTAPLQVQFTDTSQNQVTSWAWNFGDGIGTSTSQNPSYSYPKGGIYDVTLTVTGPGGSNTTTKTALIMVKDGVPVADFSANPTSGAMPLKVQFTDASQGQIASWSWDFGDGKGSSASQNPSYTYTSPGTYDVSLTVSGLGGLNTKTKQKYINVTPVPVLVVPGIAGSLSSCLFVDPASGQACPANYVFRAAHVVPVPLTPAWQLDPILDTYESLVHALEATGTRVYRVPYDWRQDNRTTAKTTLANAIAQAKKDTGSDKVDIVAHSMGGLVTRSYIEQLNNSDVRKFVMLGTPNRGSPESYYPWEGGDFSQSGFKANYGFFQPLMTAMKAGYHRTTMSPDQFVRYAVPSMRQLLPIDNYLYTQVKTKGKTALVSVPIGNMHWQNNLTPFLNYNTLIGNLDINNIQIFAGNTTDTIGLITVKGSTPSATLWADGKPVSNNNGFLGDGTVPVGGALLGNINVQLEDSEHTNLPDHCKDNVVQFLAGQPLQQTQASPESLAAREPAALRQPVESQLTLATSSDIQMGLTTDEGLRLGDFPFQEETLTEPEGYLYLGNNNQTAALGIDNPSRGDYLLGISTKSAKIHYKILVSYKNNEGTKEQILEGDIKQSDVTAHHIHINRSLELR